MRVDYIIVGQGLAGSILAYTLMQQSKRVLVVDEGSGTNASRVAAGLINPITGQRLVKSDRVDEFLPYALAFYRALEKHFGQQFLVQKDIQRIASSARDVERWQARVCDPAYRDYVGRYCAPGEYDSFISDPFGSGHQRCSGYLRTELFLDMLRDYFIACDSFRIGRIAYSDVQIQDNSICWADVTAERIVFCQGYQGVDNPWFVDSSLRPTKGEILTVTIAQPLPEHMLIGGSWLIPLDKHTARVGATYDREHIDMLPTLVAREQLCAGIRALLQDPVFHVVEHRAGVRPATRDRRPIVQLSPLSARVGMFNGFGSKGVLQIPLYAQQFATSLIARPGS